MKLNTRTHTTRVSKVDPTVRLAGGGGAMAARQDAEALLRRAVMACLLWEKMAYESGKASGENIAALVPQVDPRIVAEIAVEARHKQKLRHVPLYIAREMARHESHRYWLGGLLPEIISRADELAEFMKLYWKDNDQAPLTAQMKKGLSAAFAKFDEYQLAKYDRSAGVKLRDVMFLAHAKPRNATRRNTKKEREQGVYDHELYRRVAQRELATPDTWEVALSAGGDKREAWTRLLVEGRLGAMALLRNLRNMTEANVTPDLIVKALARTNPKALLPLNFLAAAQAEPRFEREIEQLMLRSLAKFSRLPGYTVMVVDVSGSMGQSVSDKSTFNRMEAAGAMAMMAAETCERIAVYATAGSDGGGTHATKLLRPRRGFALIDEIRAVRKVLGGGGIFTRQCIEYLREQEHGTPDRIVVFSDSQDCDRSGNTVPQPFARHNYIVDVSAHARGVNYAGVWTAEVSGWSEHFLEYIAATEGVALPDQDQADPADRA